MKKIKIAMFVVLVLMIVASCSKDPKENIVGKWFISKDVGMKDIPIEITNGGKIRILESEADIVFGDYKNNILNATVSINSNMVVNLKYNNKEDVLTISVMGKETNYKRFNGTEDEWNKIIENAFIAQKIALLKANIYIVSYGMEQYFSKNKIYPKSVKELNTVLPSSMVNPFDFNKVALSSGYEKPQWSEDRIGEVYLQFGRKNSKYNVYGFGIEKLISLEDINKEIMQ